MEILSFPSDDELIEILGSITARRALNDGRPVETNRLSGGVKTRLAVFQNGKTEVEDVVLCLFQNGVNIGEFFSDMPPPSFSPGGF